MPTSRRDFIDHAFRLAALALAAPRGARAAQGPAPARRPAGPHDRLRIAVIGVNGQGGFHLDEWLANPDAELVAVCDCDPNAFAKQKPRFAGRTLPEYVQDVRRLLDRRDIDAVSIATPNHWHALMAIWAMQSGKDVYVEKPCSHNLEEGRVMTDWARRLGRICQMGAQSRSMGGMRRAIDFIHAGKIGPVRTAHAFCYKRRKSIGNVNTPAPLPEGIDFDLWAGPAPNGVPVREKLHYDWHWNRLTGNGDLGNQNPHELDKARWGLGKHDLPRRVATLGGRLGYVDNGDTPNSLVTIFQWDDATIVSEVRGLTMKADVSRAADAVPLRVGNIWWGTDGYVVAPNYSSAVAFDYDGLELGQWQGGIYQQHFANFVKAVKSRRPEDLHLDIAEGHLSSGLSHLGNASFALAVPAAIGTRPKLAADEPRVAATFAGFEAHLRENRVDFAVTPLRLGRELVIDPATERATDAEVNALFTRDYRKGYELPRT
ncbi:MAG: Gfo/Idh/MocA family protein [Planctomycetia bacterium]|jgi:predicted dehydrogenase